MKNFFWLMTLLMAVIFAGCARGKTSPPVFQPVTGVDSTANPKTSLAGSSTNTPAAIVRPAEGLNGKVSSANANLKFVVLTFPLGQMAQINQRLSVYRGGLKVGELNVTGPGRDDSIVADVIEGEVQNGDEVRDK